MVAVSAGVAGVTAYVVSQNNQPKESKTFYESFNTMPLTRFLRIIQYNAFDTYRCYGFK